MSSKKYMLSDDFRETPFWWEAWQPQDPAPAEVPTETSTVVIGAGYAGLCCALELAKAGETVTVLEAGLPGIGASTLSGGQVTGGINVGKSMSKRPGRAAGNSSKDEERLREAAKSYRFLESLIDEHRISCDYHRRGRIAAAWTLPHLEQWKKRLTKLNTLSEIDACLLSREELREELDSDAYVGGILINHAGQLHPSKYYAGILSAALASGVLLCSNAAVSSIQRNGASYRLTTARGTLKADRVVIATNGYTGSLTPQLRRCVVPVTSHQITTEVLPEPLKKTIIPRCRSVAETGRVTNYYRYSPDRKRLMFGGRARFYKLNPQESAAILHQQMVKRFPQLRDIRVSFSWSGRVAVTLDALPHMGQDANGCYYVLGCNGSGITMMSWLGHQLARHLIEHKPLELNVFGTPLPGHPFYTGRPWFMPLLGSYFQVRDHIDRWNKGMKSSPDGQ